MLLLTTNIAQNKNDTLTSYEDEVTVLTYTENKKIVKISINLRIPMHLNNIPSCTYSIEASYELKL